MHLDLAFIFLSTIFLLRSSPDSLGLLICDIREICAIRGSAVFFDVRLSERSSDEESSTYLQRLFRTPRQFISGTQHVGTALPQQSVAANEETGAA